MKSLFVVCLSILLGGLFSKQLKAATFLVSTQSEFNTAHATASSNDSIIWESGIFSNIYMSITKNNLFIGAEVLGETIFNGSSRVKITADHITLRGFQFVRGDIGTNDVINTYGSYGHFDQINIRAYRSYKYLRIREECQYVRVTYCNFENRITMADQNILSILVDANQPGYHKIQHCSFKNFPGNGNDEGVEPIRIGLSTQADRNSRSLVEYCYFTQCDGDGELISSKASQNVYRFNTFEDNPKAELVLRHGSEAIVYGNFFLKGKGGVRVREGQNHYIYNNYFWEIDDRPIYLQNEDSDPLDAITIAFNTIFDSDEVRLGGNGSFNPTNVVFANNIFADPDDDLFEEPTGTETWIGNIAQGGLGINLPATGITVVDPLLVQNSAGFYGLDSLSPAIDVALPGYLPLPQFAGMDTIDTDILFDLMGENRPLLLENKDVGCSEYPQNILIQPIATEENTGPTYSTSSLSSIEASPLIVEDLFQLYPNPASNQINIEFESKYPADLKIDIFDLQGRKVKTIFQDIIPVGLQSFTQEIGELSAGSYTIRMMSQDLRGGQSRLQTRLFVKL
ncbi:MAG: chondroitinase-B domain-containing protein [Bacteroidia bacterium]